MKAPWCLNWELESELNEQLQETGDIQMTLSNSRKSIISHALKVRELGVHYTGQLCQFGAVAVLSLYPSQDYIPRLIVCADHNFSPYKGAPKDCAEMGIDRYVRGLNAEHFGNLFAELLVVCGPNDPERVHSIIGSDRFQQCPPCHDCLGLLSVNPSFTPLTDIILVNDLGDTGMKFWEIVNTMEEIERPLAAIEQLAGDAALTGAVQTS